MSKKHSSLKDNEIVYCHLLKKNARFSAWQLIDRPIHWWMLFPRFSFVDAFKLSALHVSHTKSTWSSAQKVDITYSSNTAHCTVLTPTPLSIWTMEAPPKMTTLTPSVNLFKGETNASKPVSTFTTKTMRHISHSSTPPPPNKKQNEKGTKKLEMLSYPHKINLHILTNVCYG